MMRIDAKGYGKGAAGAIESAPMAAPSALRLHVNVDHVATLRQARRGTEPDPVEWALQAERAGAHGITCHLRKDRRHIQDADVGRLRARITTFLNLETSLDEEMLALALDSKADAVCIVPENRREITTEGGLDVVRESARLHAAIPAFRERGVLVSLFVDPESSQIEASAQSGAQFIELHTGAFVNAKGEERAARLGELRRAAEEANRLGLRVNAGHGLDLDTVAEACLLPHVEELNIGHSIVARAVFVGARRAVKDMLERIEAASNARDGARR